MTRPDDDLLHEIMAGSGMHVWAVDLRTGEVELAATAGTGLPARFPAEVAHQHVHAEDRAGVADAVAAAVAGGERFVVDHRFIHPVTGELTWYRERGTVVRDAGGAAVRIVGTSLDVTEHKLAERMHELDAHHDAYAGVLELATAVSRSEFAALHVPERGELRPMCSRGVDAGAPELCTPLVARGGNVVGVLVTRPRDPSERERRLFDLLARHTADLVERSQAAAALRDNELRLRALFDSMDEGFYLLDVSFDERGDVDDIEFLEENPSSVRLAGRHLVGATMRTSYPDAGAHWYEHYGRVAHSGVGERLEVQRNGRWFEAWLFRPDAPKPHEGSNRRVACVWQDVTERRRAALRDAFRVRLADALRPLADTLDIQATALRILGTHLDASRVVYAGVSADGASCEVDVNYRADGIPSLVGSHPIGEFFRRSLTAGATLVVDDCANSSGPTEYELVAYRRGHLAAHITVPLVKGGRVTGFMSAHSDRARVWTADEISLVEETAEHTWAAVERAMAEAELRRTRDELERRVALRTEELARTNTELRAEMAERQRLQRQLATAQEAERRRVARDLHDQTGQLLAGLALAVRGIATAPERLDDLQRIADELAAQVHALAVQLRPTALDDLGLVPALHQLIDSWSQRSGVRVDFEASTLEHRLPPELETVLYRVVQEALTNTYKHASATTVSVIASWLDGHAVAIVEDNGCGFDPSAPMPERLGLVGMRERVGLAGGELVVESAPNRGTTVIARIPIAR